MNNTGDQNKENSSIKSEQLECRLIQLSVENEDKVKSMAILEEAIQKQDDLNSYKIKETKAECRLKFESMSKKNDEELSLLFEKCEACLNRKKDLMQHVEDLAKHIQDELKITDDQVSIIKNKCKDQVSKLLKEWKNGAKERHDSWMESETRQMREGTIKALEPEVKKLLRNHKEELQSIHEEMETQKKYIQSTLEIDFNRMLSEYTKNAELKRKKKSQDIEENWKKQINLLQATHSKLLENTISQQNKSTKEMQVKTHHDQLAILEELHRDKINSIKESTEAAKKKIHDVKQEKMLQLKKNMDEEREKILNKDMTEKTMLEEKLIQNLTRQMEESISSEKIMINQRRDAEIDSLIRQYQKQEVNITESIQMKGGNDKLRLDTEQSLLLHEVQSQVKEKRLQVEEMIRNKETLQVKCDRLREQVEADEKKLQRIKENICKNLSKCNLLESNLQQIHDDISKEKNDYISKHSDEIQYVEDEILKLKNQITIDKIGQKNKVSQAQIEYDKQMADMEQELKQTLESLDKEESMIEKEIRDYRIRTEKLNNILLEYDLNRNERQIQ